ncbi:hypothetical protein B0H13DRAFT_1895696 [Mycena leptocephala]|nr:hypothetical protein B0H13DRAFT_1895696 [Mycena leptocephala]
MGSSQCRAQETAVGEQKTGGFDISGQVFHLTLNLEFGEVLKIGLYIHVHFWGQIIFVIAVLWLMEPPTLIMLPHGCQTNVATSFLLELVLGELEPTEGRARSPRYLSMKAASTGSRRYQSCPEQLQVSSRPSLNTSYIINPLPQKR